MLINWILLIFFFLSSCAIIPVKLVDLDGPLTENPLTQNELQSVENLKFLENDVKIPPLPNGDLKFPLEGEKNGFKIKLTSNLIKAMIEIFKGDGEKALEYLQYEERKGEVPVINAWYISYLKSMALIFADKPSEAELELKKTSALEIPFTGSDLNARALRGEARLWLADLQGAKNDFLRVAIKTFNFKFPTFYITPPANQEKLVALTMAALRAYVGLAGIYTLQGEFGEALKWGLKAEEIFSGLQYVATHPIYGGSFPMHPDQYYGRAMNLSLIGSALTGIKCDDTSGNKYFEAANNFFDSLKYQSGKVTSLALKSYGLLKCNKTEKAQEIIRDALELAKKWNLNTFTWRIEVLRAKIFLNQGKKKLAYEALESAQSAFINASGSLSADKAKLRFGVGKEDITYLLTKLDIENNDYLKLFANLEKGRARSFVEMLRGQINSEGEEGTLISEIKKLDKEIMRYVFINSSSIGSDESTRKKEVELKTTRTNKIRDLRSINIEKAQVFEITDPPELNMVKAKLKSGQTLAYFLPYNDDDRLSLLKITSNETKIINLKATEKEIKEELEKFTNAIALNDKNIEEGVALNLTKILELKEWLGVENTYIIPSGIIYSIPWGALDIYSPISVLPLATWVLRNLKIKGNLNIKVVLSNPEFGGIYSQLEGAEKEGEIVASIYKTKPLKGIFASEENLRKEIGKGANILHLATHAKYDLYDPLNSSIILTDGVKAKPLKASDIYAKPLPADLVILSACDTGMGKVTSGDDFLGLTRSFYLGGSMAVINSLWPISDEGTVLFMQTFHESLKTNNVLNSWLKARNYVKKKGYPPQLYGAFVVGGAVE